MPNLWKLRSYTGLLGKNITLTECPTDTCSCVPLTLDLIYDSRIAPQPQVATIAPHALKDVESAPNSVSQSSAPRSRTDDHVEELAHELITAPLYPSSPGHDADPMSLEGDAVANELDALLAAIVNGDPPHFV